MSLTNDNTIAGNQQNDDTEMADALNGGESDEHEDDFENDNASDSAKSALETDNEGWTSDSEVEDLDNDDFLGVEQGYDRSGKYIPSWPGPRISLEGKSARRKGPTNGYSMAARRRALVC